MDGFNKQTLTTSKLGEDLFKLDYMIIDSLIMMYFM
jgi:hypothetical protein